MPFARPWWLWLLSRLGVLLCSGYIRGMNIAVDRPICVLFACSVFFFPGELSRAADEAAAGELLFAVEVLPVLREKCFACHGEMADDLKGELDVTSRAGLLKGGESSEPAIVVGQPDASLLIQAVRWEGLEMPPKENDRLSAAQIDALSRWVAAGAPWPDPSRVQTLIKQQGDRWNAEAGVPVQTSGGLSDAWTERRYKPEDLWAYRAIVRPSVGDYSGNPIDFFIQRMQRKRRPSTGTAERSSHTATSCHL